MEHERIGRYTLLRPLGEGGQGRVVEAEQSGPGGIRRRVALKLLVAQSEDLWREARLGGLLRHPHLVDVYEVGEVDGTAFCAMELCEGTLEAHRPLPPRAVVDVGLQVCAALAYAHDELGLVHLDLKPANLLVQRGAVKVADLGIARARGFEDDELVRGTPRFMAPEQRLGGAVDARTDVYALGRVLQELATESHVDLEATLPADDAGIWPGSPVAWLEPAVARCLASDPSDRWPSMEALADALAGLVVSGPGLAEVLGPPAAVPAPDPAGHLPHPSALIGRQTLLDSVASGLDTPGAHVLRGPGGIGKTCLAIAAGHRYRADTGEPAWLLDLSGVSTTEEAVRQAGWALSVPLQGSLAQQIEQVGDALDSRGAPLLILDGIERLVGLEALLTTWCALAPRVRFVLTTRVSPPRGRVHDVPPLDPAASIALVVDRAQARGVDVTHDPDVGLLAAELEGVPLALELAAGRLGVLSLAEVRERLGLSLLRSGELGLDPRLASLRGALDFSWELLDAGAGSVLAQLSVFRGGASLDDVVAVVRAEGPADLQEALDTLTDHSLLSRRGARLGLSTTVSAYAAERLAEAGSETEVQARHGRWFARHGHLDPLLGLRGPGLSEGLGQREDDLRNLEVAVQRAVVVDGEVAARCALGAAPLYRFRGPLSEGGALLSSVLPTCPDALRCAVLAERGGQAGDAGDLEHAREDLAQAAELAPDGVWRARVRHEQGCLEVVAGNLDLARTHLLASLALQEGAGSRGGRTRVSLGAVERRAGRLDEAERWTREGLARTREVGDRVSEAIALGNLGTILLQRGRVDEARVLHEQSLAHSEALGITRDEASCLANLAIVAAFAERWDDARLHFEESLARFTACGMRRGRAEQLGNLAELHLHCGAPDEARRCAEEALGLHQSLDHQVGVGMMSSLIGWVDVVTGDLSAARARMAASLAAHHAADHPVQVATAHLNLGRLALIEGEAEAALAHLQPALEALEGRPALQEHARAALGEALAAVGREDEARLALTSAVSTLRSLGASAALRLALCARARALHDAASLAEAEAVGPLPPGSLAAFEVQRTADHLRSAR